MLFWLRESEWKTKRLRIDLNQNQYEIFKVFIGFANFYRRFIRGFSRIAALLTLMLKTIGSPELAPKVFKADDNEVVGVGGGRADETAKNLSKSKNSKNIKSEIPICTNIGATGNLCS